MLLTTHNLAMHTSIESMKHQLFLKIELCGKHNAKPQDLCIGQPQPKNVESSPMTYILETLEECLSELTIRSKVFVVEVLRENAASKATTCLSELEQWAAKQSDQRAMLDIKGRGAVMVALWQQKHVRCAGHLGFLRRSEHTDRSVDLCWTVGSNPEVDRWVRTVAVVETYENVLIEELRRLQCVLSAGTSALHEIAPVNVV